MLPQHLLDAHVLPRLGTRNAVAWASTRRNAYAAARPDLAARRARKEEEVYEAATAVWHVFQKAVGAASNNLNTRSGDIARDIEQGLRQTSGRVFGVFERVLTLTRTSTSPEKSQVTFDALTPHFRLVVHFDIIGADGWFDVWLKGAIASRAAVAAVTRQQGLPEDAPVNKIKSRQAVPHVMLVAMSMIVPHMNEEPPFLMGVTRHRGFPARWTKRLEEEWMGVRRSARRRA